MITIDHYANTNKLRAYPPAEKATLALSLTIICLISATVWTPIIVLWLMSALIVWRAGIPARIYGKLMLVPMTFLVFSCLVIAFSVSKTTSGAGFLWYLEVSRFIIGIRFQDLNTAVLLFTRSLGAVSCLYFLALTTPMLEILSIMRRLKTPSQLVELMALIYRFIFVLIDTATTIYISQSSRLGYSSWKTSLNSMGKLISSLLFIALRRSQKLTIALDSRCYSGTTRVLEKNYSFCLWHYFCIAALVLMLGILNFLLA